MIDNETIDNVFTLSQELAYEAGKILKQGFGSNFKISTKDGKHNLVTEYDQKVEDFLITSIKKKYPDHHFLAEESGYHEGNDESIQWIIDPIDGTVNFARNIPMFCISIAVAYKGKVISGVIYNPIVGEMFCAKKGAPSTFNNTTISVTDVDQLTNATIATGFPYNVEDNPMHCIDQFAHIVKLGIPIRRIGSAAIDLAYVACGRFDAFWEVVLNPWDYAAGQLILKQANGMITNLEGVELDITKPQSIVASNSKLHTQVLTHLRNYED